jgi:hypothetical protein
LILLSFFQSLLFFILGMNIDCMPSKPPEERDETDAELLRIVASSKEEITRLAELLNKSTGENAQFTRLEMIRHIMIAMAAANKLEKRGVEVPRSERELLLREKALIKRMRAMARSPDATRDMREALQHKAREWAERTATQRKAQGKFHRPRSK